jgi:hypothetical protein
VRDLGSQTAQVFGSVPFRDIVEWVGVFGLGSQTKKSNVDIVIFYDPCYSEKQVYGKNLGSEDSFDTILDESRLQKALGREVNIVRIFSGTLRTPKDVAAILHAQTIYGNFNNQHLQKLRFTFTQRLKEYKKNVDHAESLIQLAIASQSSSEVCKCPLLNGHILLLKRILNLDLTLSPVGISIRQSGSD